MSAYSKVNLLELENSAQAKAAGVDARFARSHIDSEHLGVSRFRYPPNFQPTDGHSHREQEEVYVVLRGSGRIKIDDEIVELGEGDLVRVPPGAWRCTEAGADGMQLLAVGAPIPEEDDSELEQGWWADQSSP